MTAKQLTLLRFICGYQEAHGRAPAFKEMREAIGCSSKGNIHRIVAALIERGHIRRDGVRYSWRSLKVLTPVVVPHAPDGAPLFVVPL